MNGETTKLFQNVAFWNNLLPKIAHVKEYASTNNAIELHRSPGKSICKLYSLCIFVFSDPAAGFRHAMYTLIGLVIALLGLLLICIVLLKKRSKERERQIHIGF